MISKYHPRANTNASGNVSKGHMLRFRLTAEEKERYTATAKRSGMTLSAWLRKIADCFPDSKVAESLSADVGRKPKRARGSLTKNT